jgi:hypothetical protein
MMAEQEKLEQLRREIDLGIRDEEQGKLLPFDPLAILNRRAQNMTREQHKLLVERLQHIAKRPSMYFGKLDPERAALWLSGFATAIDIQGGLTDERRQLRQEILEARGWKVNATSSWQQMVGRSMTPAEVIAELIAIEIEVLNRISGSSATECKDRAVS